MEHKCPQCGTTLPQGMPAWVRQITVAQLMTRSPVTLGPEDSLMRAVEVMRLHGIRRIPIMMGDSLIGLLAEGDLKRAQPSTLDASQEEFNRIMEETQVSRIMINQPVCVAESTTLAEAARTLHETKYGALPVLKGDRLVGIITDNDLIGALADLMAEAG
jgi:acetoin utilization protein AcuB